MEYVSYSVMIILSCASDSLAAGTATRARTGLSDVPGRKRDPGPPGWGLGVGLICTLRRKK
jgi:hypothetical protein